MTKTLNKWAAGSWPLAVAAALGMFALAGCNQRESANETAKDVTAARQDANQNVAEEKKEAADVATQGTEDRAAAEPTRGGGAQTGRKVARKSARRSRAQKFA